MQEVYFKFTFFQLIPIQKGTLLRPVRPPCLQCKLYNECQWNVYKKEPWASTMGVVTSRMPIPLLRSSIGQAKYFLDQVGFFLLFLILI